MNNRSSVDGGQRTHLRVWDSLPWVVNGTASESVRSEVDAHLRECMHCREEFVSQQRMHGAMNSVEEVELPVERGLDRLLHELDAREQVGARVPWREGGVSGRWAWVAYGLAAMVLVEAGGLVALGTSTDRGSPAYRTLSSRDAGLPQASIRLVIDPSMTAGKLQALLVPLNLQIVGGPNEDGVYSLGAIGSGHDIVKDVAALRAAPGVRFVEPVGAARSGP